MNNKGTSEKTTKALIFGAGQSGYCALHNLVSSYNIVGFVDNSAVKQGQVLCDLPVYSPDNISDLNFDLIFIASEYIENIKKQLIEDCAVDAGKVKTLPSYMTKPMQFGEHDASKNAGEMVLKWLCQTFNEADIHYFLDAGTLLGIVRDGALIPWDDDLDIGIPFVEFNKITTLLQSKITELELLTGRSWYVDEVVNETEFGVIKRGDIRSFKLNCEQSEIIFPMVDLFIKYTNGKYADYALASRGISMPIEHFETTQWTNFKGVCMKLPASPELYLERYYGDWKTPQKEWDVGMIESASSF